MKSLYAAFLLFTAFLVTSCASSGGDPSKPAAPWAGPQIPVAALPPVYIAEWSKATNRATCALIAPVTVTPETANPRRANFSGGWAVAYDTPDKRSAFGIAGSGALAADPSFEWPQKIEWRDGSTVTYGPEGGKGPNQVGYLRVAGQQCLYNVWSELGIEHLEQFIESLRVVDMR